MGLKEELGIITMSELSATRFGDDSKFTTKPIRLRDHPVFIVGEKPGKQRAGQQTGVVWEGNRSGDFIMDITEQGSNMYLTNVCNYQDPTPEQKKEGLKDLEADILKLKPNKAICLGVEARVAMAQIATRHLIPINLVFLDHPSYVLRFNKDVEEYKTKLIRHLEER